MINATYWGNSIYSPVFKAVSVLVTPPSGNQAQEVFSVDSNSTVTALAFNSGNNELSFSVSGETGTTGFVDVCIGKSLVSDPSIIRAYIDGNAANYTVASTEGSWILHFSFHHSSHSIMFVLNGGAAETILTPEMPQTALPLVMAGLVALAAVVVFLKGKQQVQILREKSE